MSTVKPGSLYDRLAYADCALSDLTESMGDLYKAGLADLAQRLILIREAVLRARDALDLECSDQERDRAINSEISREAER